MRIAAEIEGAEVLLALRNGEKRLAYAVVNAVNATAKRVQQAEFAHVRSAFTIRKPAFFFGSTGRPGGVAARISTFASVKGNRAYAEVEVAQASSIKSQRRLLLSVFESGGPKKPSGGPVAVPRTGGPARPTFQSGVPKEWTFAGMGLKAWTPEGRKVTKERRGSKGRTRKVQVGAFGEFGRLELSRVRGTAGVQWKGRNRSFLLSRTRSLPLGGVFRRTGGKRVDIELVYPIVSGVTLRKMMSWERTADQTARQWFKEEMQREVIKAVAFARGRGL